MRIHSLSFSLEYTTNFTYNDKICTQFEMAIDLYEKQLIIIIHLLHLLTNGRLKIIYDHHHHYTLHISFYTHKIINDSHWFWDVYVLF